MNEHRSDATTPESNPGILYNPAYVQESKLALVPPTFRSAHRRNQRVPEYQLYFVVAPTPDAKPDAPDFRSVVLTRTQLADLAREIIAWLAQTPPNDEGTLEVPHL